MSYGCFVDIRQQDGKEVRMYYAGFSTEYRKYCEWMGIMEQMAAKFTQSKGQS